MAELPTADDIKALVSLLAPGFIITSLRARVSAGPVPELPARLIGYGFVSAAYFAGATQLFSVGWGVALPLWLHAFLEDFGLPLAIGVVAAYTAQWGLEYRITRAIGLHISHHIPAAWDYTFDALKAGAFVLVTLDDDTKFRGLMGERSFASSNREERDLLLEEVWTLDGTGTWAPLQPNRSVLICGRDIRYVEIFEGWPDER